MEPTLESPPQDEPAARSPSRAKVALAAVILVGLLSAWGAASVLAASPTAAPSASPGASSSGGASTAPSTGTTHTCPNDAATSTPTS